MDKSKARFIVYSATSAFNKLGGNLVPRVVSNKDEQNQSSKSKLEIEVTDAIIRESRNIILQILEPIFKEYPELKEEFNTMHEEFGYFPC